MKIFEKTVMSKYMPHDNNVVWIDISGETPIVKVFNNGKWDNASSSDLPVETEISNELKSNTVYNLGTITDNITIPDVEPSDGYQLYIIMFDTNTNSGTVTFPQTWIWQDDEELEAETEMHYEISVCTVDGKEYASFMKFPNPSLES